MNARPVVRDEVHALELWAEQVTTPRGPDHIWRCGRGCRFQLVTGYRTSLGLMVLVPMSTVLSVDEMKERRAASGRQDRARFSFLQLAHWADLAGWHPRSPVSVVCTEHGIQQVDLDAVVARFRHEAARRKPGRKVP